MGKNIEIRWHGRGGQGAKTAALLLADVAFGIGKFVQGFPEYGPERMGAPITAYNRIGDEPVRLHSNIYKPDFVVVVDETLLDCVDVTAGLSDEGVIIINTDKDKEAIQGKLKGFAGKVHTIDARRISMSTIGKDFPNMPILAAVVKIVGIMDDKAFLESMQPALEHKFAHKPEMVEGNMMALKMALKEVE